MIDKSKQSTTLNVCLDDAGAHNKAILDFFFAKLGQHIFRCVNTQEEANVLLIDYDFPPARKRYEEEYQHWQKPALALSISEVTLNNAIWLAKPLTSRALLDAAETLQKQVTDNSNHILENSNKLNSALSSEVKVLDAISISAPTVPTLQRPQSQESLTPDNLLFVDKAHSGELTTESNDDDELLSLVPTSVTVADEVKSPILPSSENNHREVIQGSTSQISDADRDKRTSMLCGAEHDIEAKTDLSEFYQEDSFFLSSLKDAIRLARQCQQGVLLNFPKARIYVLPEIHRMFCRVDIHKDEFTDLIAACNVNEGGKMHILSTREIHELNDMISQQSSALYDLEAFVWTSTLLSAKGRLPRALDPNKPVGLKHWPSLTRLENFPNAMSIAAQWSASAIGAFDIAKSLNISQRYVFSFYNAANSLGLIEQNPEKLINKQPAPRTKDVPRGLFSRLLKRLIGG